MRFWLRLAFIVGGYAGVYLKVVQTHLVVICNFCRNHVSCIVQTVIYCFVAVYVDFSWNI
jgi:uncharacterized membrane protein